MQCGGNNEPTRRALAGAKCRGPQTAEVRATLAHCFIARFIRSKLSATDFVAGLLGPYTFSNIRSARSVWVKAPSRSPLAWRIVPTLLANAATIGWLGP